MEYRTGKCSACGAEYKIPASFAHDVARCKVCQGVVHIARAPGQARQKASDPARSAPPREAARSVPADAGARPERRDSPRPAPARERPGEERAAPELVGAAASQAPVPAAERQPLAARANAPAPATPLAEQRAAPASAARRGPPRGLLIAAGLLLLAAAAWLLRGHVLGASSPAQDAVSAKESTHARSAGDPLAQSLRSQPDFGPAPGTSDAEWAEMNTLLATWMDEPGESGDLARTLLIAKGYEALPVIVNRMRELDLLSPAEEERGRRLHDALREICAGHSLEWKGGSTTSDVVFDEQVILDWGTLWERASHDVNYLLTVLALEPGSALAEAIRTSYAGTPAGTGAAVDEDLEES